MAEATVLVTGASGGIGWHLAKIFAQHGHGLVLVARSADKLEGFAQELQAAHQVRTFVIAADLAQAEAPERIAAAVRAAGIEIDILVNNAGVGLQGRFAQLDLRRQMDMIQLNVNALAHLTRLFLPGMIERNRGGVINVASTAGFQPGPLMAVYYATKAFVLSFTEALHEEVAGTALHVTCLCPGPTATGFAEHAGADSSVLFRYGVGRAEAVAQCGYDAFVRNRAVAIPGPLYKLLIASARFAPRALVRKLAMRANR